MLGRKIYTGQVNDLTSVSLGFSLPSLPYWIFLMHVNLVADRIWTQKTQIWIFLDFASSAPKGGKISAIGLQMNLPSLVLGIMPLQILMEFLAVPSHVFFFHLTDSAVKSEFERCTKLDYIATVSCYPGDPLFLRCKRGYFPELLPEVSWTLKTTCIYIYIHIILANRWTLRCSILLKCYSFLTKASGARCSWSAGGWTDGQES